MVGAGAVVALGTAFTQAGNSSGMLAYRLLTDGIIASAWLVGMIGMGWVVVRKMPVPMLLRIASAGAVGMGAVSLLLLGLGLLGWLNGAVAWGIVVVGVGAAAWWGWLWKKEKPSPQPSPHWKYLWLLLMPFLGLALVGAVAPPGLLWQDEPAGYDVTEYHLQVPREWYEAGKISALSHNVFSYMPMNVEMHDLLAMDLRGGPWAGMYLAQFIHVMIMVLAVLAAAGVAGALLDRAWAAPLAAGAMGVVPWVTSLAPIAYDEGGLMLFGALAMGWVMLARDWRGWLLAGVMAGLACGVKLTAAPMLVIAVVVARVAVAVWPGSKAGDGEANSAAAGRGLNVFAGLAIFVAGSVAVFSPWLVRNLVWAGNPVFPEGMEVLGKGHFSDVQMERWRLAHSPKDGERTVGERLALAWKRIVIDWRYGFLFLPLAIAAMVLTRDRRAAFLGILLIVQLLIWLAFTHLQGRFFILALPIGAVAIGMVRWRGWIFVAGGVLGVVAVVGFVILCSRYAGVRQVAEKGALGVEDLTWMIPLPAEIDVEKLPADRPIVLVGDAQAFLYSGIPMSRLKYRTVFDVAGDDGKDWLAKWTHRAHGTVLVFPGELERFRKSYFSVPTPGEAQLKDRPPYELNE